MEKVALVTGASRGIGKACALRLAECGYDIVVNYNSNEAKAQEVVSAIEALGQKAVAIKANTADLKEVQNMFREAHKAFGRLDVLVNNAGVVDDAFLLMINEDSLTRSLDINIKGYFHCAQQAALKMMSKKQGVIINVSSVSSILAVDGQGVYSATKGAVNSMTAALAKELAPRGIRVNAVAPGFIETEMLDAIPEDKTYNDYLNPDSLTVVKGAKIEPALANAAPGEQFQFVRDGYYCKDTKNPDTFNRIVGLKDSFPAKK